MASITILKRLQMLGELDLSSFPSSFSVSLAHLPPHLPLFALVTALIQLESLIPSKRYREIASSLAVRATPPSDEREARADTFVRFAFVRFE